MRGRSDPDMDNTKIWKEASEMLGNKRWPDHREERGTFKAIRQGAR